jgi:hypothetical protein
MRHRDAIRPVENGKRGQPTLPVLRRQFAKSRAFLGGYLNLYQIHSATFESGVLDNQSQLPEANRFRHDSTHKSTLLRDVRPMTACATPVRAPRLRLSECENDGMANAASPLGVARAPKLPDGGQPRRAPWLRDAPQEAKTTVGTTQAMFPRIDITRCQVRDAHLRVTMAPSRQDFRGSATIHVMSGPSEQRVHAVGESYGAA